MVDGAGIRMPPTRGEGIGIDRLAIRSPTPRLSADSYPVSGHAAGHRSRIPKRAKAKRLAPVIQVVWRGKQHAARRGWSETAGRRVPAAVMAFWRSF